MGNLLFVEIIIPTMNAPSTSRKFSAGLPGPGEYFSPDLA
jgi:hypothetical protein